MWDLRKVLAPILTEFEAKLLAVHSQVLCRAKHYLMEDIRDPKLNNDDVHVDRFMLRANQIGVALLRTGFYSVAEEMYRDLLRETLKYRQDTGKRRHVGAFYANIAGACVMRGDLDRAVVELLKAARADANTHGGVAPHQSYAITSLLPEYFVNPVEEQALQVVQTINPTVTVADMEALGSSLGARIYAFLAYAYLAQRHETFNREIPNEFSQLQIFSALRSLASLLEVVLKTVAGDMSLTFSPVMTALYSSKRWWQAFESKRAAIRPMPSDDRLGAAIAMVPTDDDSTFWKSLLISYIVRNYTIHQLETNCALVQSHSRAALGHILHVMMTASRHT